MQCLIDDAVLEPQACLPFIRLMWLEEASTLILRQFAPKKLRTGTRARITSDNTKILRLL